MGYLTAAQIETSMATLAAIDSAICTRLPFSQPTRSEGGVSTIYSYLRIGQSSTPRRTVLIVAGQHAREWAQPDAVISFVDKLLRAFVGGRGFTIPPYTDRAGNSHRDCIIPRGRIRRIIRELCLLVVPLANPDGRAFAQISNPGWRKNRAPRPNSGDPDKAVGVDLNRNHPFAWHYEDHYTPAFASQLELLDHASRQPTSEVYRGPRLIGPLLMDPLPFPSAPTTGGPYSQPEVWNIHSLINSNPVTWCIDLHSYAGKIMHPWATETTQTTTPGMNFRASTPPNWDGPNGSVYSEYMPPALLGSHKRKALAMVNAIQSATGRAYTPDFSVGLYPHAGTLLDSFFSRQFMGTSGPALHAFTMEAGFRRPEPRVPASTPTDPADGFQPIIDPAHLDYPHGYPKIEREIHAVLHAFLRAALR